MWCDNLPRLRGKLSQGNFPYKALINNHSVKIEENPILFNSSQGLGGRQTLERRNVERPIFRNFKIANIKITKNELYDSFIFAFNFSFFRNHLNTQNI